MHFLCQSLFLIKKQPQQSEIIIFDSLSKPNIWKLHQNKKNIFVVKNIKNLKGTKNIC